MENNIIPKLIKEYSQRPNGYGHYEKPTIDGNITKFIDTRLRFAIGKTEDIRVALCSHQAIIQREFPQHFCRVCNKDLSIDGISRWNDFLVLRHPQCFKPICGDCAENNPDVFHIAFRRGLSKLN